VCFVNLASIKEASRVPVALAAALGVTSTTKDPWSEIVAFLSDRSLLLLLDNCEHVLDTAAKFAERVLREAPRVHVLSTSREPLRSVCESVYDLKGLDVPPEQSPATRSQLLQYPAVRFFVERAGALAVAELSDDDLPRVSDICRRLAGNPLALEIAAAHVESVGLGATPSANPGDYLQLLSAGVCTGETRHRTLQATFDWSYDLLTPVEQSVFRRLSVFAARFDLDEAAAVLVDEALSYTTLFECLINLVRKSLLVADTAEDNVLYHLPDVLRAYAGSKMA
jgi:predicted ATPase